MNSIKLCEYSRSRSFHDDLILQDQASGERSQDQWSSGIQMLTYLMARSILETGFHMDKSENTRFVWKLLQPETGNLADAVTT